MITRISITEIEAKKPLGAKATGFDVLFNVEDAKVINDEVILKFTYRADYKTNAGYILIKGELVAKENKETIKKVEEGIKNKILPHDYMQSMVNTINYFGTTNATVIATVLNTMPPIKMPILKFKQKNEQQEEAKDKK